MVRMHHDTKWLIHLLSQNEFIPILDGLGTFIHRTNKGWRICGRDDVVVLLKERIFNDLSFALVIAKSIRKRFYRIKLKNKKVGTDFWPEIDHATHWTERALSLIKERTYPTYESGSQPTVRELARRYKVNQQKVVDELEDHESVSMNVGLGIRNGVHEHKCIGDYNFEWIEN